MWNLKDYYIPANVLGACKTCCYYKISTQFGPITCYDIQGTLPIHKQGIFRGHSQIT